MIPHFEPMKLHLGPLTIEIFGVFVALGACLTMVVLTRHARSRGLNEKPLWDGAFWALAGGLASGHWVHLFFYHPEELAKGPLQPLRFWDGSSSMGGVLGGTLAVLVFFAVRKLPVWEYADSIALGLASGWSLARVGCFAVHDHPGVRSDFPLAVAFPDGARHDLGLYDALFLAGIYGLLFVLSRKGLLQRRLIGVLALTYGAGRFCLDFLRATDLKYVDARYLGLTPAQYFCMFLVSFGVYRIVRPPRAVLDSPGAMPSPVVR